MERKTVRFQVKSINEDTGVFEGTATVFSFKPDPDGDIIDHGAFNKTLKEGGKRVKILFDANPVSDNSPNVQELIGRPLKMAEEKKGLFIKGKLSLGVPRVEEALSLMRDDAITEISIGFDAIKALIIGSTRHLKEIRLRDIALVPPTTSSGEAVQREKGAGKAPELGAGDFEEKEAEARIEALLEKIRNL